jgi:hypothetical protein
VFIQEGVGMDLGTLIGALIEGPALWDRIIEQIGLPGVVEDMETYVIAIRRLDLHSISTADHTRSERVGPGGYLKSSGSRWLLIKRVNR